MVVSTSSNVGLSTLKAEFNGNTQVSLSDYYNGGSFITVDSSGTGLQSGPPSSGQIAFSQFRGRWKNLAPSRYPPAGLTSDTTTLSGQSYGNGTYTCSHSYAYIPTVNYAFKIFDRDEGTWSSGWSSVGNGVTKYNSSTGAYVGSTSTTATNSTTYNGEWLQWQFPVAVKLCEWYIVPRSDFVPDNYVSRMPNRYIILGSNNGTSWDLLIDESRTFSSSTPIPIDLYTQSTTYTYFRFIVNTVGSTGLNRNGADIAEIRLFCTTV